MNKFVTIEKALDVTSSLLQNEVRILRFETQQT